MIKKELSHTTYRVVKCKVIKDTKSNYRMPMKIESSLRGVEPFVIWMIGVIIFVPEFIVGLKDVSVTIPQAVRRGDNALFICNYDMENDTLYSVKWYKGRREFYRYTPKENPAMKTFLSAGINVERNLSNQSHVVLLSVPQSISGKFTCEISVDAPSFLTAMVSGEMEVVELPEQPPIVTGIYSKYRLGDLVDGNCSIKFSKPAANLTWTINGVVVPLHHIKMHQIEKYTEHNLESVYSEIGFMVTTQHFVNGKMMLKCTASIFNIYNAEVENLISEDRPRIMASGRSLDNTYPYDQQSSGDFEDHNESYLTYYSAADVSSSATAIYSCRRGLTVGRLVSLLHRLVVSTSSASLSSITNVSRLLLKGQIENAEMLARIVYFIAMTVAATTTATATAVASASTPEGRSNNAARAYATMIMFAVAVIEFIFVVVVVVVVVVLVVIFFVRWRFNDFLSTEKGYYILRGDIAIIIIQTMKSIQIECCLHQDNEKNINIAILDINSSSSSSNSTSSRNILKRVSPSSRNVQMTASNKNYYQWQRCGFRTQQGLNGTWNPSAFDVR